MASPFLSPDQLRSVLHAMRTTSNGYESVAALAMKDVDLGKTRQLAMHLLDHEVDKLLVLLHGDHRNVLTVEKCRRLLDAPTWDNTNFDTAIKYFCNADKGTDLTPQRLERIRSTVESPFIEPRYARDTSAERFAHAVHGTKSMKARPHRWKQLIQVLQTKTINDLRDADGELAIDAHNDDDCFFVITLCSRELMQRDSARQATASELHIHTDPRSGMQRVHSSASDQDMEREIAAISVMEPDELKRRIADIEARKSTLWREMAIASAMQAALQHKVDKPNSACIIS